MRKAGKFRHLLFDPDGQPVRGVSTSLSPLSLKPGQWSAMAGVRTDDGTIRVREGHAEVTASAANASATFCRGKWHGTINGTRYTMVAWRVSSATHIYSLASGAWTEMTSNATQFGNTRFTTDNPVTFAVVKLGPDGTEVLVAQNGAEEPRIIVPTAGTNLYARILTDIDPPSDAGTNHTLVSFPAYVQISGASPPTYSNLDADFRIADYLTSPNNYARCTITTAVDADDWVKMQFSSLSLSNSHQLIICATTPFATFFDNVKIEISEDNATWDAIWDGSSPSGYEMVIVPGPITVTGGVNFYGFSLGHIAAANLNAVTYLRITWKTAAVPTVETFFDILGVYASGKQAGQTQYAVGFSSGWTGAESPARVSTNANLPTIKNLGGPDNGVSIVNDERLYYKYTIYYKKFSQTTTTNLVSRSILYRRDPGESEFYQVQNTVGATFSAGTWNASGGSFDAQVSFGDGHTTHGDPDYTIPMPDGFIVTMPSARTVLGANGRSFVGNVYDASTNRYGDVWFSDLDFGLRFRKTQRFLDGQLVLSSGGRIVLNGEVVQALVTTATSTLGVGTVHIFTDKSITVIAGLDAASLSSPSRVSLTGTLSPASVTVYENSIYWLDPDRQVRRLGAGSVPENLSRYSVDATLRNVPDTRIEEVTAAVHKDRLYLAYTASGGTTNARLMVYNLLERKWESADETYTSPITAEELLVVNDGGKYKLYSFNNAGKAYELEQASATQDLGSTNPTVNLTTNELHDSDWKEFFIDRVGIVCDDVASGSLSVTRTMKPGGASNATTIDIDVDSGKVWQWSADQAGQSGGAKAGCSGLINITGGMTGGSRIYALVAELESREDGFSVQ